MTYEENPESKRAGDLNPYDLIVIAGLVYEVQGKEVNPVHPLMIFKLQVHSIGIDYNAPVAFDVYLQIPRFARVDTVRKV